MDTHVEKTREILASNIYCTIATATSEGKPWISPVFFAIDEKHSIYWVSNKNALHSNLIRKNPQIAIVVFNSQALEGDGDGVYIDARAEELSDMVDLETAIEIYNQRSTKEEFRIGSLEEVTDKGEWRIYKATPIKIEKLTQGEYVNGQYVEKKVDVTDLL